MVVLAVLVVLVVLVLLVVVVVLVVVREERSHDHADNFFLAMASVLRSANALAGHSPLRVIVVLWLELFKR